MIVILIGFLLSVGYRARKEWRAYHSLAVNPSLNRMDVTLSAKWLARSHRAFAVLSLCALYALTLAIGVGTINVLDEGLIWFISSDRPLVAFSTILIPVWSGAVLKSAWGLRQARVDRLGRVVALGLIPLALVWSTPLFAVVAMMTIFVGADLLYVRAYSLVRDREPTPAPYPQERLFQGTPTQLGYFRILVGLAVALPLALAISMDLVLTPIGMYLLLPLILAPGRVALTRARRLTALGPEQLLEQDRRPPILMLRSFGEEKTPVRHSRFWRSSLEGALIDGSVSSGPTIAVANPNPQLLIPDVISVTPDISIEAPRSAGDGVGAARVPVASDWMSEVKRLTQSAQAVLLVVGVTEGVKWEMDYLLSTPMREKVLFVLPPTDPTSRAKRWSHISTKLELGIEDADHDDVGDSARVLFLRPGGDASVITSKRDRHSDYSEAVRVGLTQILRQTVESPATRALDTVKDQLAPPGLRS